MMKCENMNIGGRSIILFIFAYQILMNLEMKATPRAGTPACEKTKDEAGTPASEKENGRGLPQLKKIMRRGLLQEKKKRKEWAGTPA